MLGFGKKQPAGGHRAQDVADQRQWGEDRDQRHDQRGGEGHQHQGKRAQPQRVAAGDLIDHFAQEVIAAGMGRRELAHRADAAEPGGSGDCAGARGKAGIA